MWPLQAPAPPTATGTTPARCSTLRWKTVGRPGGSLDLSIYVSDSADNSGHIDIAPDATVKAIYPPDY
jgi:hypothetical protein